MSSITRQSQSTPFLLRSRPTKKLLSWTPNWGMYSTDQLTTHWFNMIQDRLSSVFFALADPTRRGVLARLATGDATVKELAKPYQMSLAAVSKHLKVLEAAGLISHGPASQQRPRPTHARSHAPT